MGARMVGVEDLDALRVDHLGDAPRAEEVVVLARHEVDVAHPHAGRPLGHFAARRAGQQDGPARLDETSAQDEDLRRAA